MVNMGTFFSGNLPKLAELAKFNSLKVDTFSVFTFFIYLRVSPFIMEINKFLIKSVLISIKL